ncbi:hypothetical protein H4R99_003827 [Coemansia sp. RSA 1722]|nr:hypothetical protein LPJ57_001304 [Coemansia sp. RSA 486]KAJ2232697.1 hypothetical protein IWW45_004764 [Coemansia sp. RSA 485]KAJ2598135.1 hypothetical protein GGF39_002772 [Coemansia sp. RSA 1721]KAJ2599141.1 hypothetical protein H4R99_003827 [Coemansia sp. RSA 1722]KAJ2636693.1 hypothetical protein GGF40_002851 [Coemansia sp. RSA 1286]
MTRASFRSIFPDVDIPLQDLATYFFSHMHMVPEFTRAQSPRPVFIDGTKPTNGREEKTDMLTLDQMETLCNQLASGFHHKLGVQKGDVVAVVLPNSIYYLAVTMAVLMLGATCSMANPAYTAAELAHQLKDSNARFIITSVASKDTVDKCVVDLGCAQALLSSNTLFIEKSSDRSVFGILSNKPYPRVAITGQADKLMATAAFICYSGGTTGLPKGVVLSHYNVVANIQQGKHVQQTMVSDKYPRTTLAVLPMFHSFGLVLTAHSLPLCGSTLVVMPRFDFDWFLNLIERHRVTDTLLVPPIINLLVKMADSIACDLSSLQWVISGAAPLDASTAKALEEAFPGVRMMPGYGLTEASPGLALNTPTLRDLASSGPLLPNVEAKVIDVEGRSLGPNATGELCFRGPNVMVGYLNSPEETQRTIDEDGFLHTGDVGFITEDTLVHVTDRIKELIKYNGFQVAPAELEGILLQHPNVRDCAVVGVFDRTRQTELPRAFVVLNKLDVDEKADAGLAIDGIVCWLDSQVAHYKRLRGGCVAVDCIPKTASGKILRRVLRDKSIAGENGTG